MKPSWIVLIGAAVLVVSTFLRPAEHQLPRIETFLCLLPVLLLMLITWKWRGVIWILLGIVRGWSAPGTYRLAEIGHIGAVPAAPAIDEALLPPIGMYVSILGSAIIVAGGLWDVLQRRRPHAAAPIGKQ